MGVTAAAAVSVLNIRFPSVTGIIPCSRAASISSGSKPPSGPTNTAAEEMPEGITSESFVLSSHS